MNDLDILARGGMVGLDAETSLKHLYGKLLKIGQRLDRFRDWEPSDLLKFFGSDAGRAAVLLLRF